MGGSLSVAECLIKVLTKAICYHAVLLVETNVFHFVLTKNWNNSKNPCSGENREFA